MLDLDALIDSENGTGTRAIELFIEQLRVDGEFDADAIGYVEKFLKRAKADSTIAITYDGARGYDIKRGSFPIDAFRFEDDGLINPLTLDTMTGCHLAGMRYKAGKLEFLLDEGEVVTFRIEGAADANPKPFKIPAPKSDIQGLDALEGWDVARAYAISDASCAWMDDDDFFDEEDELDIEEARKDRRAMAAFAKAVAGHDVIVNGKGPVSLDAAIQWNHQRRALYIWGKKIDPEVGNIQFNPTLGLLMTYECDKERETVVQIVAQPAGDPDTPTSAPIAINDDAPKGIDALAAQMLALRADETRADDVATLRRYIGSLASGIVSIDGTDHDVDSVFAWTGDTLIVLGQVADLDRLPMVVARTLPLAA